jgi:hypothetical protein
VDDFDDLFGGRERGGDLRAQGAESDVLDQIGDDGEADIGLDEGDADLAEGFGPMFSSVMVPWPRRALKERWSLSLRDSNMLHSV